jgi:hypothetical protein
MRLLETCSRQGAGNFPIQNRVQFREFPLEVTMIGVAGTGFSLTLRERIRHYFRGRSRH